MIKTIKRSFERNNLRQELLLKMDPQSYVVMRTVELICIYLFIAYIFSVTIANTGKLVDLAMMSKNQDNLPTYFALKILQTPNSNFVFDLNTEKIEWKNEPALFREGEP